MAVGKYVGDPLGRADGLSLARSVGDPDSVGTPVGLLLSGSTTVGVSVLFSKISVSIMSASVKSCACTNRLTPTINIHCSSMWKMRLSLFRLLRCARSVVIACALDWCMPLFRPALAPPIPMYWYIVSTVV